ncbi:MFS transporter, partial [Pseudonocardia acaciae]|uniref:MFS transporter n=1 Tax=Pseudonocardia acaciae TaxID=551276 RepID=UPI0012EE0896
LNRLRDHEDFFHRQRHEHESNEAGLTHDKDAAEIVEQLQLDRGFKPYWWGSFVDDLGSAMGLEAFKQIALSQLNASNTQIGLLTAVERLPGVVVGLLAGPLVDRVKPLRLMIRIAIAQFILMFSVPVVGWFGLLQMWQVYLVAGASAALSAFFGVATSRHMDQMMSHRLDDAIRKMKTGSDTAYSAGLGIGGLLATFFGPVATSTVDAFSYLFSAGSLSRIRGASDTKPNADMKREGSQRSTEKKGKADWWRIANRGSVSAVGSSIATIWKEIVDGLRFVATYRILREIAARNTTNSFFSTMYLATYYPLLTKVMDFSPLTVGVLFTAGVGAGLLSVVVAPRISARIGSARTFLVVPVLIGPVSLLYGIAPFVPANWMRLTFAGAGMVSFYVAGRLGFVLSGEYLRRSPPKEMRSRVTASLTWLTGLGALAGAVTGGALSDLMGDQIGLPLVSMIAMGGMWAGSLWIVFSPLRAARDFVDAELALADRVLKDLAERAIEGIDTVRARLADAPRSSRDDGETRKLVGKLGRGAAEISQLRNAVRAAQKQSREGGVPREKDQKAEYEKPIKKLIEQVTELNAELNEVISELSALAEQTPRKPTARWAIWPNAPPDGQRSWHFFGYIALVGVAGFGAGLATWYRTGGDYRWIALAVAGVEAGLLGLSWAIHRWHGAIGRAAKAVAHAGVTAPRAARTHVKTAARRLGAHLTKRHRTPPGGGNGGGGHNGAVMRGSWRAGQEQAFLDLAP